MANKKSHKKHADNPSQPSKKPVSDAPRSSKTTDPTPPPLPPRTEIVDVTLGYPVFFPLTIPVTMSMLCCMPPGVAKLDFNGHCYNTAVAVGVVCWNMKFSNYVEYYLYNPNDKSETYFNVIQCPLFDTKIPHCYPMGTYVTATGIIVGTTESTFMMALEVSPITERRYNEHVFQARMVKFWCAVDCVSKPVLPDARLFRVSNKFNVEQLRMEIVMKLLAEYPAMARTLALAAASSFAFSPSESKPNPVKFKETSDSVFSYFRLCGHKLRKPVWPLQNRLPTKSNGTPEPANINKALMTSSIPNSSNATVLSVPYKHDKACKCACSPNIDDYNKLVDFFLDVGIMELKLAVSFYNNHVPVTVAMLNALPEKDKLKWGGLTFKTVRVIGKVISKTIDCNEIHYVLEDLQTSAQYSVLQYISEDTRITAPMTFAPDNYLEVLGDLHAKTKKRNYDAVIADHVRRVDEKCPFVHRFIDNAAYVQEYDDETIQIVLLAMSFTDYSRYGKPPSKFPASVAFDLLKQFNFNVANPIDFSGVRDKLNCHSGLL